LNSNRLSGRWAIANDLRNEERSTMDTIDIQTTLGALVNSHPELARQFERLGLDYCCGGGQSLADACADHGLDPAATAKALADVTTGEPAGAWATMGMTELVDHLEITHHRYLWEELPRLSALIVKIVAAHGERHPELHDVAVRYEELRADMEPHLLKEERVLFPMIRELAASESAPAFHCGTLQNPISVMLREHDTVGALLAELRRLTNDYMPPADGCASYAACCVALANLEADTHLHIHKENNVLFPMVLRAERAVSERSVSRR
jgi:regulator of cell morphogenesis and NO signaling